MRKQLAKALLALVLMSGLGAALGACHTVQGVGDDISNTGRAMERAF
jgi:predicted small secreted protein